MYKFIKEKEIASFLTLFQVITPIKSGTLGVENLNINLQKLINNTNSKGIQKKLYEYKLADKVIHIKNENMKAQTMKLYKSGSLDFVEKRVFNGQLGMIIKVDHEKSKLIVLYPNDDMVVFYDVVASVIILMQRKGRTARHRKGKVAILYCKDTNDEI